MYKFANARKTCCAFFVWVSVCRFNEFYLNANLYGNADQKQIIQMICTMTIVCIQASFMQFLSCNCYCVWLDSSNQESQPNAFANKQKLFSIENDRFSGGLSWWHLMPMNRRFDYCRDWNPKPIQRMELMCLATDKRKSSLALLD